MKKKNISLFVIIASILFITPLFSIVCLDYPKSTNKVPDLLNRSDKIKLGKEWDEIQNEYAKYRDQYAEGDLISGLNLVSIFIQEARVTGEHGHYYPSALKITDQILSDKELDSGIKFQALLLKAGVQLSLHDFSDALDTGLQAKSLNANNSQVFGVLVDAYIEMGEYDKAVEAADQMISIKPDIRSYSRISYLREIYGDKEGAIEAMIMAVKSGYPGSEGTSWAMLTLGELFENYGQTEKARIVYADILKQRPDYPFAISALAELKKDEDIEEAEILLDTAIDIIPEVGFYIQKAEILKEQSREKEFENIVNDILDMLQDDTLNGHNMNLEYADVYLNLVNDHENALKFATTEYEKRPNNIDVNAMMAKVLYHSGDTKSAKDYLRKTLVTNSKQKHIQDLVQLLNS